MAYTAISRLTSLSGLHFIAFDPTQIRTSQKVNDEYLRLTKLAPFTAHSSEVGVSSFHDFLGG
jgi:ATP-dependent exoDNAse (exonuclease V) alpha subunit